MVSEPVNGNVVVLVTAPSQEEAAQIARALVQEKLAACVNVLPAVRSIYRWEGQVQDEPEALMVVKTRAEMFERLRAKVVALHTCSCPEVIALPVVAGHAPYLDWLAGSVGESE